MPEQSLENIGQVPPPGKLRQRAGFARKLKAWLGRLSLLMASFVAALFIGEFVVRTLSPQNLPTTRNDIWLPKAGIGHERAPNVETTIDVGEGEVRYLTDRKGYRIGPEGVNGDARRILALGDSFLEALAVEYEETMTGRLEQLLAAELNGRFRIANTGVGGYSPNHYLIKAKQELADDKFDLVLVFIFVGNDFVERRQDWMNPRKSSIIAFRMPKSLGSRELVDAAVYPAYRQLRERSHLMVLTKNRTRELLTRMGLTKRPMPTVFLRNEQEALHWDVMTSLCSDIAAESSRHHTPITFVILPADYQVNERLGMAFAAGSGYEKGEVDLDQPNRWLGEFFADRELSYVDTTPALRDAFTSGELVYGILDRHFNAKGHEVVARQLAPVIVQQLQSVHP